MVGANRGTRVSRSRGFDPGGPRIRVPRWGTCSPRACCRVEDWTGGCVRLDSHALARGLGYSFPRLRVATHPQALMRQGGFELDGPPASLAELSCSVSY